MPALPTLHSLLGHSSGPPNRPEAHASTCIKGGAQLSLHRLEVAINVWHVEAQSIQVQASPGNNDTCRGAGGMRCMGWLSCWPACIKVAYHNVPMQSV